MKTYVVIALLLFGAHVSFGQIAVRVLNYRPTGDNVGSDMETLVHGYKLGLLFFTRRIVGIGLKTKKI